MTDQLPPELFAERPVRSDFARQGVPYAVRRILTVCVLALIVGGGLYWAFTGSRRTIPGEIPTIKSDGPYKQRPENPGGIDIPHQDVEVYQTLDSNGHPQSQVEHLLPPPEAVETSNVTEPSMPAAPLPAKGVETVPAKDVLKEEVSSGSAALVPAASSASPLKTTAKQNKPAPAVVAKPAVEDAASSKPTFDQVVAKVKDEAAIKVPEPAASPAKGTVIQLAALPDEAAAQSALAGFQKKYASVLGTVTLRLVKADLGAKGVYYRIQSTALPEDKAKSLCASLKDAKAGCILVRN